MKQTLAVFGLVVLALCGCNETEQSRYDTVAEAREHGLFSRGWAPDVLPDNAGPIAEAHDLDTNARCLHAAFPSDSLAAVRSALFRAGFAPDNAPTTPQQPEEFCPFSKADLDGTGKPFSRRGQEQHFEHAALHENGTLYYWSTTGTSP
jgi:hypothetical protein